MSAEGQCNQTLPEANPQLGDDRGSLAQSVTKLCPRPIRNKAERFAASDECNQTLPEANPQHNGRTSMALKCNQTLPEANPQPTRQVRQCNGECNQTLPEANPQQAKIVVNARRSVTKLCPRPIRNRRASGWMQSLRSVTKLCPRPIRNRDRSSADMECNQTLPEANPQRRRRGRRQIECNQTLPEANPQPRSHTGRHTVDSVTKLCPRPIRNSNRVNAVTRRV